jgi:hypothetical protein
MKIMVLTQNSTYHVDRFLGEKLYLRQDLAKDQLKVAIILLRKQALQQGSATSHHKLKLKAAALDDSVQVPDDFGSILGEQIRRPRM